MVWEERIWYLKERPTYNKKVNHSYLEPKMLCAWHSYVPPAGSFSPARARIFGHACSTDAAQSGEDVFASLHGWHTCIPYPAVVSLRNCGTPQLGPTFSTCAPPTSTVNIVFFEGPTMPNQFYKESLPLDFCSLSYSSA